MSDQIEIRHLRYFLAVAEELHFGRAAHRLGMTQPPLSLQIQQLEANLGLTLFERTSRSVELTVAGQALLGEARTVIADFDRIPDAVRRAARGETGSLSVAFVGLAMFLTLPRIIRRFRQEFPSVRLELRELSTSAQQTALRAGDLDIGFLRESARDPELIAETMIKEGLLLAISKRHPLASRKRLRLSDVANEDFVLFPRELTPGLHERVLAVCAEAGVYPRIVQTSQEIYTTISLVEAGLGVTIVPASVQQMPWKTIRYVRIPSPNAVTRIDAVWRVDNGSAVLAAFLEIARSVARA
jgi:LysR family transcriptional regulator, benzoate and cis,cis-muconate-responsive activator of ben and cat genes